MREGEKFIHARVFTQKFSRDVITQEDMQKQKTSRRWNETGEQTFIHTRVFTLKFSRDVMFTPYMNTSLTRRPVFTQEAMQKKKTSRRWNETGETIHSHESFHTEVFTGRYVYSLSEYKSHKETCIHTRGHAKRRKPRETGMRHGKKSFTREFSHQSFHGTLCLLLI